MNSLRCPNCSSPVFLETLDCPTCTASIGFHAPTRGFFLVGAEGSEIEIDGSVWVACSNRFWKCNWLADTSQPSGACRACRLTRRQPSNDDTLALERLADTAVDKRRLLVQLNDLGLPVVPFYEREGGLAFDLVSSRSGEPVTIGHANGVITIDLAESLDDYRETLRVKLGEVYRTVLGHFRHEVGHYFQNILVDTDERWAECRRLFGDERTSYSDAIARHYRYGAPATWRESFISDYATMHPWEDFAETFAHYLHITGTVATAAGSGLILHADRVGFTGVGDIVARFSYADRTIEELLADWHWLSLMFNRVNRSMGLGDFYPFDLTEPVITKLSFVHALVTDARG
ncbi:zinc-binding metallopeptidase family protein [Subtercola frigoramans]|uniref:Zinc-ribbon domain-containing protein n=1 Tax=Subtercola frigoramans TaxID=120298 RepID=A0ABS2L5Z7_9MICO|nr:putative zinc-binding metallopeptidase [Subtercola frigoramans]MBM7472449.1 hypothetical protein [Subtercola frigoramans]